MDGNPAEALAAFDDQLSDEPAEVEIDPKLLKPSGVINVKVEFPDGRKLVGAFAYTLPISVRDITAIGVMEARWRGGFAPEALSADIAAFVHQVAYVQVAVKSAPGWAEDWREVPSLIVTKLYQEVRKHEATFLDAVRG